MKDRASPEGCDRMHDLLGCGKLQSTNRIAMGFVPPVRMTYFVKSCVRRLLEDVLRGRSGGKSKGPGRLRLAKDFEEKKAGKREAG